VTDRQIATHVLTPRRSDAPDGSREHDHGPAVLVGYGIGVDVEGHARIPVAQPLGDEDAVPQQDGGVRVPQLVKPQTRQALQPLNQGAPKALVV
jgi:hypothetical protein